MYKAIDRFDNVVKIEDALINTDYYCPECNEKLITKKRGLKKHPHFAHKTGSGCVENKYDPMCEWHINWQERFPEKCREVVIKNESGKRHIADVIFNNFELEFQHSGMPVELFEDRTEFYHTFGYKVVWIFDGNDVFNQGYNSGPFPFTSKFECLKKIKNVSNNLDIFIEGNVQQNLITDYSGLYLHHVESIDEKTGINFDGVYTVDNFMDHIENNYDFIPTMDQIFGRGICIKVPEYEISFEPLKKNTLLEIVNDHPDVKYLIAYNTVTGYDILIDEYNINRLKSDLFIKGKLKTHGKSKDFKNRSLGEIYFTNKPVWVYQGSYKKSN